MIPFYLKGYFKNLWTKLAHKKVDIVLERVEITREKETSGGPIMLVNVLTLTMSIAFVTVFISLLTLVN